MASQNLLLSVYMPVFNAAPYLPQSIESILSQSHKNFELVIVDDHSIDHSWSIIQSYAQRDHRIRAYRNPLNFGVSLTSNIAISKTRSKFLARMDADDISTPDRLEKHLHYLQAHPKVIIVGGQCTIINDQNQIVGFKHFPTDYYYLRDMLFWAIPVQQGYMMINRSLLPDNFTWYSPSKTSAEETDLYFHLLCYGSLANLPDNLYFYRHLPDSLSHRSPKTTFWLTFQSRLNALRQGFIPSPKAIILNLLELILITLLPSRFVYQLWYLFRGVTKYNLTNVPALEAQNQQG